VSDDGEVFRRVAGVNAAVILAEGHVEHPVEAILDAPVAANGGMEGGGIRWQTGEVVASFGRDDRADPPDRLDADDALEVRPHGIGINESQELRVADGTAGPPPSAQQCGARPWSSRSSDGAGGSWVLWPHQEPSEDLARTWSPSSGRHTSPAVTSFSLMRAVSHQAHGKYAQSLGCF
jgi:hypothetical protein